MGGEDPSFLQVFIKWNAPQIRVSESLHSTTKQYKEAVHKFGDYDITTNFRVHNCQYDLTTNYSTILIAVLLVHV